MNAPDPRRGRDKPRRDSIEKPPPRPERKPGQERGGAENDAARRDDFDPNVNSTRP